MTSTLRLEKITPENLDAAIGLRVHPEQEHLVARVVKSLAEAYVHPGTAWPRLILDGDTPVGFLMGFFDTSTGWETARAPTFVRVCGVSTSQQLSRVEVTVASPSSPWQLKSAVAAATG